MTEESFFNKCNARIKVSIFTSLAAGFVITTTMGVVVLEESFNYVVSWTKLIYLNSNYLSNPKLFLRQNPISSQEK